MSKGIYSGVSSEAQKVTKMYLGVSDKAHKIKKGYIGAMNFESRELPSGYTQVEYIQSSGTQYIDTGFTAKNTTKIVADCEITYGSGWIMILGSYDSSAYFSWWAQGTNLRPYFASSNKTITGPSGRMTLVADGNIWSANDTSSSFTSSTFTATSSTYLFSVNNGGNYTNATMKLYSCQIYDNGTLVRDFVPCKNSSGTAGLYDLVNSKFYTNAGTGSFTAGNELMEVARLFYISQLEGSISVDKTSITIEGKGQTASATLTYVGNGVITATSSDTSIITVSVSGNTVTITAVKSGSATVTISIAETDDYSGDSCTISIKVNTVISHYGTKKLIYYQSHFAAAANSSYAMFAGGSYGAGNYYLDQPNVYTNTLTQIELDWGSATYLNQERAYLAAAANSQLIFFGGGRNSDGCKQTVDFYDLSLTHDIHNFGLSEPTTLLAAASAGDQVIFFGGRSDSKRVSDATTFDTSASRNGFNMGYVTDALAGASFGNLALFGGGRTTDTVASAGVTGVNAALTKSSPSQGLIQARCFLAAGGNTNYVIFGGGVSPDWETYYNTVDAYTPSLTRINPASLSNSVRDLAATNLQDKYIIFSGGMNDSNAYNTAEAFDESLTKTIIPSLTKQRRSFAATSISNFALFGGGCEWDGGNAYNTIDVYKYD